MRRAMVAVASCGLILGVSAVAGADPVTLTFAGARVTVAGEFINGVPVPAAEQQFAGLFAASRSMRATLRYDTNQPDTNPAPDASAFLVGALSVSIPEIGLTASRASSTMQISVFDNAFNANDQFFVAVNGVDAFTSNVGLPVPVPDTSFTMFAFGPTSMLPDDSLPTAAFAWTFGNLSFNFPATDGTTRQVLLTFEPGAATPQEQINAVIVTLADLVLDGKLTAGEARGLVQPLRNALRSLGGGHVASACSQVRDFEVKLAQDIAAGILTPAEGAPLLQAAEDIRAALGC